jgi:hypothetical protein
MIKSGNSFSPISGLNQLPCPFAFTITFCLTYYLPNFGLHSKAEINPTIPGVFISFSDP